MIWLILLLISALTGVAEEAPVVPTGEVVTETCEPAGSKSCEPDGSTSPPSELPGPSS